jgi:aspartate carbamoyltransferase catalytic subunit
MRNNGRRDISMNLLGLQTLELHELAALLRYAKECLEIAPAPGSLAFQQEDHVAILSWARRTEGGHGHLSTPSDDRAVGMFQQAAASVGVSSATACPDPIENFTDVLRSITAMTYAGGLRLRGIIVRHQYAGVPAQISRLPEVRGLGAFVINAGDGSNEDPAEALTYLLLLAELGINIGACRCTLIGGIDYDPVGRSLVYALAKFGAKTRLIGPPGVASEIWQRLGVEMHNSTDTLNEQSDVVFSMPVTRSMSNRDILPSVEDCKIMLDLREHVSSHTVLIHSNQSSDDILIDPLGSLSQEYVNNIRNITPRLALAARTAALLFAGSNVTL